MYIRYDVAPRPTNFLDLINNLEISCKMQLLLFLLNTKLNYVNFGEFEFYANFKVCTCRFDFKSINLILNSLTDLKPIDTLNNF